MAKAKTAYVCTDCGAEHNKWQGQCIECGVWNTLSEVVLTPAASAKASVGAQRSSYAGNAAGAARITPLTAVALTAEARTLTGIGELDRVLGGGLVDGSVVLIGGDPGIGKSTLLLQMLGTLGGAPAQRVRHRRGIAGPGRRRARSAWACRWSRCRRWPKPASSGCWNRPWRRRPRVLVIDSIQTIWTELLTAAPGSVSQVRESAAKLTRFAKETGTCGVPGRPRDQGGRHRRPARARTHGRRGAVFRGRVRQPLPRAARVQEPLRRGQRTGRVRDVRQGPARGAQSVGDLPVRAQRPDAGQRGDGHPRGHAAAAGGGAGAGRPVLAGQSATRGPGPGAEPPGHAAGGAAPPRRRGRLRPGRVRQRGRRHPRAGNRGRPAGAAGGAVVAARPAAAGQDRRLRRSGPVRRDPPGAQRRGAPEGSRPPRLPARHRAARPTRRRRPASARWRSSRWSAWPRPSTPAADCRRLGGAGQA